MADDVFGILGSLQADAFRVDQVVAEGGFAVVYRAHHLQFRADVALKCLKVPGTLSAEQREHFLEGFRAEAELLFRLSSSIPAVVRPLHVGALTTGDNRFVPFIALEWLEGKPLSEALDARYRAGKPRLSLEETVELLAPVARALQRAHHFPGKQGTMSVLHRDIKPDNLFVAQVNGERLVKILDFGIAKVKRTTGQVVGHQSLRDDAIAAFTPGYAAPEQWTPKRFGQTGPWTDLYSFALVVVEVLSGHEPFEGDLAEIMAATLDTAHRPTPRSEGVVVSDAVERVFAKALAVDPRERYHDVGQFWDELEAAMRVPRSQVTGRAAKHDTLPEAAISAAERSLRAPSGVIELEFPDPGMAPGEGPATLELAETVPPTAPRQGPAAAPPNASAPRRQRPDLAHRVPAGVARRPEPPTVTLGHRLAAPLKLLAFAAAVMLVDLLLGRLTGTPLAIGPVRALWIAGPLAALSVVLMILALVSAD